MAKAFIAYDNEDASLGYYFVAGYEAIKQCVEATHFEVFSIPSCDCVKGKIASLLHVNGGSPFLFIALSHGNYDEFVSIETYIDETNAGLFVNSIIYSTACSTGGSLGATLIENGCCSFIGYTEEINIHPGYEDIFLECENFGIKSFLSNKETIEDSFNKMRAKYTDEVDRLIQGTISDLVVATTLLENRDSLILLGNGELMLEYFQ